MELEDHDHTAGSFFWRRCKSVTLEGDMATWELENKRYDVVASYEKAPHRQLIQADSDALLLAFFKSWGPLRGWQVNDFSLGSTVSKGSSLIAECRLEHRKLAWKVKLFAAIEDSDNEAQRGVLSEFLSIRKQEWATYRAVSAAYTGKKSDEVSRHLRRLPWPASLSVSEDPTTSIDDKWIATAKRFEIEARCHVLLNWVSNDWVSKGTRLAYAINRVNGRYVVKAASEFGDLTEALHWMLWQDIFQGHPLRFCADCPKLIVNDSRRAKKFCSPECARRKTVREWQRRNRAKGKGKINGTQKAR